MEGYKVFKPDWTCRGFQYAVGQVFEENVEPVCCEKGFHFCKELGDCFDYYSFDPDNKVARVVALGDIDEELDNSKCCTNKIQIMEELSWEEVLRLVNLGKGNAGLCNSGNRNSGDYNSGNRNSGDWNSGDFNSGDLNSGDYNSGNRNSGDYNSGDLNSGDYNSGNRNSGDWNKTSFSGGCFNTEKQKVFMFNKPSDWTLDDWLNSRARRILKALPLATRKWVRSDNMTDEEKEGHPEYKTTGGFLKIFTPKKDAQLWYDNLSQSDKCRILNLPNFDAEIFEEITGIKV